MRNILRYLVPVLVGLGLGLGAIWLSGGFQAKRSGPVVVAGAAPAGKPGSQAVSTASATPTSAGPTPVVQPSAPPGIGGEYLALGDSVAYGVGAPNPTEQGYAGLFYSNFLKRVQPDLIIYRNLAVPGETSSSFISPTKGKSQLQRALDELEAAAKAGRRISPITLTIGGNDMLEARGKSDAEREMTLTRFEANFSRILDSLKGAAGGADLIVTTYYNPYAFNTGGEDLETNWVRRFNDTIRQKATERGARLADFFGPVSGRERALTWIGVGDVHPNTAGHPALAQALWKASGYDTRPPSIVLTYTPLPPDSKVPVSGRLAFKISVQDEWSVKALNDSDNLGAGVIPTVSAALDETAKSSLLLVPSRYTKLPPGVQEYSYIMDTTLLTAGPHRLRFEANDAAGNIGTLEVSFEIGQ